MPAVTLTCLAPGLKQILEQEAHHLDPETHRVFMRLIEQVAGCPPGMLMGVGGSNAKPKRAPSAYNNFMKDCASKRENGGQGKDFKTCTVEWRSRKR